MSDNKGNELVISEHVISKIACVAAKEVSGVKDVIARPADLKTIFSREKLFSAVKISNTGNAIELDINLILDPGVKVMDVAEKVQTNIKEAVQNMTGYVVTKVNVNIEDLAVPKEVQNKQPQQ